MSTVYYERIDPQKGKVIDHHQTGDLEEVYRACKDARAAGLIFRVFAPAGACDVAAKLAALGAIQPF